MRANFDRTSSSSSIYDRCFFDDRISEMVSNYHDGVSRMDSPYNCVHTILRLGNFSAQSARQTFFDGAEINLNKWIIINYQFDNFFFLQQCDCSWGLLKALEMLSVIVLPYSENLINLCYNFPFSPRVCIWFEQMWTWSRSQGFYD